MTTALDQTSTNSGSLDDQLISRLLYHRIIVLGSEVNDAVANRLCAQLLLLADRSAPAWPSTTPWR
jgi:ATP-dependent Clp protease protease subunit